MNAPSKKMMTTTDFHISWLKVKIKLLVFVQMLSVQYILPLLFKLAKVGTVDANWLIDWIVFYAVSAIFQPYNGGVDANRE